MSCSTTLTFLKEGKFTGLGIDSFAAEGPTPERPLCRQVASQRIASHADDLDNLGGAAMSPISEGLTSARQEVHMACNNSTDCS